MTRIGPTDRPSLRADFANDDLHDNGTRSLRDALDNTGSLQHTPIDDEGEYRDDDNFFAVPTVAIVGAAALVAFLVGLVVGNLH